MSPAAADVPSHGRADGAQPDEHNGRRGGDGCGPDAEIVGLEPRTGRRVQELNLVESRAIRADEIEVREFLVTITRVAGVGVARWLSNSVNPMVLKMTQKQRAGTLTDADRKEWQEYARARDLSPSLEGQRVYRKQRPADKEDLVVEVPEAAGKKLEIAVFSK
jgi:hypothetical protein